MRDSSGRCERGRPQVAQEFLAHARKESECDSAAQPAQMCGDLGWLQPGQWDAAFESALG